MGRVWIKAIECYYKEHDISPKEQFINSIYNEEIMQGITKELMAQNNAQEIDSEQVVMWAQRVEEQRAWKKY